MSYTVDASRTDRVRYVFTSPHAFELELRPLAGRGDYLSPIGLSPSAADAVASYLDALTDAQTAAFVAELARRILAATPAALTSGQTMTYKHERIYGRQYIVFTAPYAFDVEVKIDHAIDMTVTPVSVDEATGAAMKDYLESLSEAQTAAFWQSVVADLLDLVDSPPINPPADEGS